MGLASKLQASGGGAPSAPPMGGQMGGQPMQQQGGQFPGQYPPQSAMGQQQPGMGAQGPPGALPGSQWGQAYSPQPQWGPAYSSQPQWGQQQPQQYSLPQSQPQAPGWSSQQYPPAAAQQAWPGNQQPQMYPPPQQQPWQQPGGGQYGMNGMQGGQSAQQGMQGGQMGQGQFGQQGMPGGQMGGQGQFGQQGMPGGQMGGQGQFGQQGMPGGQMGGQGQYGQQGMQGGFMGGQGQAGQPGGPGQQQPGMGMPGQQQPGMGMQGQQQPGMGMPGQQQGMGQGMAGGVMGGPGAGQNMQALQTKLQTIIQQNQLQAFYPPQVLQNVVQRLARVDFTALSQKWRMPKELAYDLASLSLYDIVIYADDSGSMAFEENGERIDDLKMILGKVAEVATLFDDDGILIRFMNGNVQGNGIRDSISASQLVSQVQFNGMTPLGTNLQSKVLQPIVFSAIQQRSLQKPVLIIVITDGEPTGEPANQIMQIIKQTRMMCQQSNYGPNAVCFEFAQVGKDQKAQAFLARLDNDPECGSNVDATSYYELEAEEYARKGVTLSPELWLVKLMVGAVDSSFDEQD